MLSHTSYQIYYIQPCLDVRMISSACSPSWPTYRIKTERDTLIYVLSQSEQSLENKIVSSNTDANVNWL